MVSRKEEEDELTIRKLQQENQQLRRELNDAYHRIRELEGNLAILVVSSADDDTTSVEVQSVMDLSWTSSMTTIPTGSPMANEMRAAQQKRDDRETLRDHRKANRASRLYNSSKKLVSLVQTDPSGILLRESSSTHSEVAASVTRVPSDDLFLDHLIFSSISESDEESDSHYLGGGNMIGKYLQVQKPPSDRRKVSTFTSGYFMRVESSDDDLSLLDDACEI